MIEKIFEENVWDKLKQNDLPIILYGMGNGADMVIDELEKRCIHFDDIFASDKFVRGQFFHDKKVLKYSDIIKKYKEFIIIMCFAVHDEATLEHVKDLAEKHTLYAPNVPIVNDGIFTKEYIYKHDRDFDTAYSLLADEKSRKTYIDVLNFKVSGNTKYLFRSQSNKDEVYSSIFRINKNEVFVDIGAYNGDTVFEFLKACQCCYKKIYAFEPDKKNFAKLVLNTEALDNISLYNIGAWDKKDTLFFEEKQGRNSKLNSNGTEKICVDCIDSIIKEQPTIIKMDIEGSEERALIGASETIKSYQPSLYVCAYHRNSDMFTLPLLISTISDKYKFYFRHHPYIPAWESNFYCIANI